MNYAIIVAGGVGRRMGKSIPKQFLKVDNKPVLVYTLETFQAIHEVNSIVVVCVKGWETEVRKYIQQYHLTKVKWVIQGGSTVQESIHNGVNYLYHFAKDDDNIIIHDGVRPLVDSDVVVDVLNVCKKYGNGVSSMPYYEQMFIEDSDNPETTHRYIPRDNLRRVSTPQAYKFKLLYDKYQEAFKRKIGIYGSSYTNTMMVDLGVTLHLAAGSDKNLKLTTQDNLDTFRAYLSLKGKM